jgi:hypothetical protein
VYGYGTPALPKRAARPLDPARGLFETPAGLRGHQPDRIRFVEQPVKPRAVGRDRLESDRRAAALPGKRETGIHGHDDLVFADVREVHRQRIPHRPPFAGERGRNVDSGQSSTGRELVDQDPHHFARRSRYHAV